MSERVESMRRWEKRFVNVMVSKEYVLQDDDDLELTVS